MVATQIRNLTLHDVHEQFQLQPTRELSFFPEWQGDFLDISESDRLILNQIQTDYLYMSEDVMQENAVKMVVLSPLLSLAGFYRPPFRLVTEKTVKITTKDQGRVFRGFIDVLVLHKRLWMLVVESKGNTFSLEVARPQALTYMLGNPSVHSSSELSTFGLITNGVSFRFLKAVGRRYGESDEFYVGNSEDLVRVLQILRRLGGVMQSLEHC